MFKGSIVAIVPRLKTVKSMKKKLGELVEFQIENGTDGIVAVRHHRRVIHPRLRRA
ncbi:MAG: hypothetical protein MZV65_20750 [Chromatiales bacterium]|nr:hypothetical protein [Chromatiales bacterium]